MNAVMFSPTPACSHLHKVTNLPMPALSHSTGAARCAAAQITVTVAAVTRALKTPRNALAEIGAGAA